MRYNGCVKETGKETYKMDKELLLYEIRKNGMTAEKVSQAIGISKSAFSKKINGKSEFTLSEIQAIVNVLGLESPMAIFFAAKVS